MSFAGLELFGIAWGQKQPDHVLGFQMFNEASRLTIHLKREVRSGAKRKLVRVVDGHWRAPNQAGQVRDYSWPELVTYSPLNQLDRSVHASYGLDAQLMRLQQALDYVARHTPDDAQTLALVADVETTRNGQPPSKVRLRAEKP